MRFDGPYNHGDAAQLIQQVQNKQVEGRLAPREFAAPGVKLLIAPVSATQLAACAEVPSRRFSARR